MKYRKLRKRKIDSLPAAALEKFRRLCSSDMTYREIANWLLKSHNLNVSTQNVYEAWQRMRAKKKSGIRRASKTIFLIEVRAPGARSVGIQVLSAPNKSPALP